MATITNVVALGVHEGQPSYLRSKIQLTNFLSIAFFLICIPFTLFTEVFFEKIVIYPALFLVMSIVILVANYFHLHTLSRFIACFIYISLYTLWHCSLLPDNQPLIASLYAVQIVFWMVPWLLFDMNEPKSLLFYTTYYLGLSLMIPELNNVFSISFDVENLKSGWLCSMVFFLAGISISCPLFFFMYMNFSGKRQLDRMVDELTSQNNKLEKSQMQTRQYLAEIEKTRKEERQRSWINDGEAIFNRQLQEVNLKGAELFDKVISDFVKYIGANQCALFLLQADEEGQKVLALSSCFAYDRKKFLEKTVGIGEGILGQAILEKELVQLTDIPKGYIKITSGLGEAPPRHLIVAPLIYLDQAVGVFEVATFNRMESHVVDLVGKFTSSLAIAVHSIRTRRQKTASIA